MAQLLLTRDGRYLRLLATGSGVAAQHFDSDPALGGSYRGVTQHPAKTLDEVQAVYEARGWTGATTDNTEPKAEN